jgi:hypothetical protein
MGVRGGGEVLGQISSARSSVVQATHTGGITESPGWAGGPDATLRGRQEGWENRKLSTREGRL